LEKLRFKDKVDVKVLIDPEIESLQDMIQVPPLLIQPIVENSFKHGLFHKKGRGKLWISYKMENQLLKVTVEDDGIGRDASSKISKVNDEKQTSSGIKTTLERIELLNFGSDNPSNSIDIIDLFDDNGNARGTKTLLWLAVNNS